MDVKGLPVVVSEPCTETANRAEGPRRLKKGRRFRSTLALLPQEGPTGGFFDKNGVKAW